VLRSWDLTGADLDRQGVHPAFGVVGLGWHLAIWVSHDPVHLAQIPQALATRYAEAVGLWRAYLWE
jgi:hypothetical protein